MKKLVMLLAFMLMFCFGTFAIAETCDCSKCSSNQVCCRFSNGHCSCFPGGITCPRSRELSFNFDDIHLSGTPILTAQKCNAGEPGCADMKVPPPVVQAPQKSTDTYHPPTTYPKPDSPVNHTKAKEPPSPCPAAGPPTCK